MRSSWTPQPLRHAIRRLGRDRLLSGVAVVSLALGIGAAAAIFSLVNAAVLRPLAYPQPDRLVFVREVVPELRSVYPTMPVNVQHLLFWRRHARATASLAAFETGAATLTGAGEPLRLDTAEAYVPYWRRGLAAGDLRQPASSPPWPAQASSARCSTASSRPTRPPWERLPRCSPPPQ